MTHTVRIEVACEDGTTDVLLEDALTDAPLVPRGELIEVWDRCYRVLGVRQALTGYGTDLWTAATTYTVEPSEGGAGDRKVHLPTPHGDLIQQIWKQRLLDSFQGEIEFSQSWKKAA